MQSRKLLSLRMSLLEVSSMIIVVEQFTLNLLLGVWDPIILTLHISSLLGW